MPRIIIQTDDDRHVETIDVPFHQSPTTDGRLVTGRNAPILGALGRALDDARAIQAGRDPERPSERAMRLSEPER